MAPLSLSQPNHKRTLKKKRVTHAWIFNFLKPLLGEYVLRWLTYCLPGVMAALQLIENTTNLFYAIVGFTLLTTAGILVQERRISVNARILVFCIGLVGLL